MPPSLEPTASWLAETESLTRELAEKAARNAPGWGLARQADALSPLGAAPPESRDRGLDRLAEWLREALIEAVAHRLDQRTPLYAARDNEEFLARMGRWLADWRPDAPGAEAGVEPQRLGIACAIGGFLGALVGGAVGVWLWPQPTAFIPFGAAGGAGLAGWGGLTLAQSPWLRRLFGVSLGAIAAAEGWALLSPASRIGAMLGLGGAGFSRTLMRLGALGLALAGVWLVGGAARVRLPEAATLERAWRRELQPTVRLALALAEAHARRVNTPEDGETGSVASGQPVGSSAPGEAAAKVPPPRFQVTDGEVKTVSDQLSDVVLPALDLLLLHRGGADADTVLEWVGEAFQKLELAGLEPILIDAGEPMREEWSDLFRSTQMIAPGTPVRMRLPAWRLHDRLLRRGEIAPARKAPAESPERAAERVPDRPSI